MRARWLAALPLTLLACNGLLSLDESFLLPPVDSGAGLDAAEAGFFDADTSAPADAAPDADAFDAAETAPDADAARECAALDPNAADFYVDRAAVDGGTGSAACPLTTITEALRAAKLSAATTRTIHAAAGTYDAALGETFPIVLRGVSLRGAGAGVTVLDGAGTYDHTSLGGTYPELISATLLVGDASAVTEIADLTLKTSLPNSTGVFCDRGTAVLAADPVAVPNTRLSNVTIGPTYAQAFAAVTTNAASLQSGCNARLLATSTTGVQTGVFLAGCGRGDLSLIPVAAEIGDDTEPGRTTLTASLFAVQTFDCVTALVVRRSTLAGGVTGGLFTTHAVPNFYPPHFVFRNSTIRGSASAGLQLDFATVIESLEGNTFTGNTAARGDPIAAALLFSAQTGYRYPRVLNARSNVFSDNDIGILFARKTTNTVTPADTSDFGTNLDPGNNRFLCNAVPTGFGLNGSDIRLKDDGPGATFPFVGNIWDHAPPTQRTGPQDANGLDIAVFAGSPPTLDTSGATATSVACPANRVAGP